MPSILRAFAWLRWRMFVNAIERTGSRDLVERFSLAVDRLGPIVAGVLMIPSALSLAGVGAGAGFALARGDGASILAVLARYALLPIPILCAIGPILLPSADRVNPVRLLLLPIGRPTLYVAQSAAALADPWVMLMLAVVAAIPLGLLAGGSLAAAATAAGAGFLMLAIVVGISSATTSALHLVVRNRGRGELVALAFLLLVPVMSLMPGLVAEHLADGGHTDRRAAAPAWVTAAVNGTARWYPSEIYIRTVRRAAEEAHRESAGGLGGLILTAVLLNGAGLLLFTRIMGSPAATGARRDVPMRAVWRRKLPGFSRAASAIALTQVRLALRTPRGRAILLSPLAMAFLYVVIGRQDLQRFAGARQAVDPALTIGGLGAFISLLAILPLAMNQFAVDGGGLTRGLLSPVSDRDYLLGKAAGNAIIAGAPAAGTLVAASLLLPGEGTPAAWAGTVVGLTAIYVLIVPVAAAVSALFPRVVDLNSIGSKSNAHGLAGLIGVVAFVLAAGMTAGVAALTSHWVKGAGFRLAALCAWCLVSVVTSRLLLSPVRRLLDARRENLALLRS